MRTGKKRLLCIVMLLMASLTSAQITVNLALTGRMQPWPADWANPVNGQLVISYIPQAVNDPDVKLRTTLRDGSTVIASSNMAAAKRYTLKDGVNLFSMADAFQIQNLRFSGQTETLLQRTGRLKAGLYEVTIEVMNAAGDVVRGRQTRSFAISGYQLPVLMSPADGSMLDAHTAQNTIVFRWTSLVPGLPGPPDYNIQVFEVLTGQTPMQAFRSNQPLLNERIPRGTTQYVWRPGLAMIDSTANKQFIWTIQTFDREGRPVQGMDAGIQGRSSPAVFYINRKEGEK